MSSIYIVSDHGKMYKKGETIMVYYNDDSVMKIFPFKTEQLIIIGGIEITNSVLKLLMHYKIETIFLNKNGKFNGKLVFDDSKNILLRQKQFNYLNDEKYKLNISKNIVIGKLKNQLVFMQRIIRERNINDTKNTVESMKNNIEKTKNVNSIEQLRGYEGIGVETFSKRLRC